MIFDSAGALYGTTYEGGTLGFGTAFKLSPPSVEGGLWTEEILHSFTGGSDGAVPYTPLLVLGTTVYGTTYEGGTGFCENQSGADIESVNAECKALFPPEKSALPQPISLTLLTPDSASAL